MSKPLRVLFAGTPDIALFSLETLLGAQDGGVPYQIVGVLTNPDRPAGRHRTPVPPPVKVVAVEAGIPVLQPERLDGAARREVQLLSPDLLVSVAYGKIFGPRFMALFPAGGVNVHPSLLPRHRGPSPLQAAILAGDDRTGVTIQYIAPEMDTGAIIFQEEIPLPGDVFVSELHDDLGRRGARLLLDAITAIASGTVATREQEHSAASYCTKISKDDGNVTWRETARELHRMVRAYTPWPGVRFRYASQVIGICAATVVEVGASIEEEHPVERVPGMVLGVDNGLGILVQTTDGLLALRRLKPQTRKEMDFQSFLNGNRDVIGAVLTKV